MYSTFLSRVVGWFLADKRKKRASNRRKNKAVRSFKMLGSNRPTIRRYKAEDPVLQCKNTFVINNIVQRCANLTVRLFPAVPLSVRRLLHSTVLSATCGGEREREEEWEREREEEWVREREREFSGSPEQQHCPFDLCCLSVIYMRLKLSFGGKYSVSLA